MTDNGRRSCGCRDIDEVFLDVEIDRALFELKIYARERKRHGSLCSHEMNDYLEFVNRLVSE